MEAEISIRPAVPGDGLAMSAYVARLVGEGLDTILLNRLISPEEEEEWIGYFASPERGVMLLAWAGERVVGMIDIRRNERAALSHSGAFGMSVDSAWRGRGVGRRLLKRAIAEARSWPGFCRLELGVTPWNVRAIALYESLGFVLEARKAKAINLRGKPEDDLLMALVW